MKRSIWVGYDGREAEAFAVCRHSLRRYMRKPVPIHAICLDNLLGLYHRQHERRDGRLWDVISQAPMSTEFAISRFLTPLLAGSGWALFMDCDILARADVNALFEQCDPSKAVMCVQHRHEPPVGTKMDGQAQVRYARKNWSSVMAFNCDHPANKRLKLSMINELPGRELHRFCWLDDDEIGALGPEWNFLVGHTDPAIDPKLVHFTEGGPWLDDYRRVPFADEWLAERGLWLRERIAA